LEGICETIHERSSKCSKIRYFDISKYRFGSMIFMIK
jgi:hypothetical protein